jgi:hypothetical protein
MLKKEFSKQIGFALFGIILPFLIMFMILSQLH